jgi:putative Mn2+ efflux pump MntP
MIMNISIYWGFIAFIVLIILGMVFYRSKLAGKKDAIAKSALEAQLNTSLEAIRQSITLFSSKK